MRFLGNGWVRLPNNYGQTGIKLYECECGRRIAIDRAGSYTKLSECIDTLRIHCPFCERIETVTI